MELGAMVVVSLQNPKEKVWGQLVSLKPEGVTLRAIDLTMFDDFVQQAKAIESTALSFSTVFYPLHRVERIALDEVRGEAISLTERFEQQVGKSVEAYLTLRGDLGLGSEG